ADDDVRQHGRRLREPRLLHFAHAISAYAQSGKAEIAIGVGDGALLALVEHVVAVGIQEDGEARQPRITLVLHAVAVDVFELLPGDGGELEVADILTGDRGPRLGNHDVGQIRRGLDEAWL